MECSTVQALRPRVSTSAGQSFGVARMVDSLWAGGLRAVLVWEAQAAKEVQLRQLEREED